jgi:hypothetical protein
MKTQSVPKTLVYLNDKTWYYPDMIVLVLVAARASGILPRKMHVLRKYVASSGKSLPTFRDNLSVSS